MKTVILALKLFGTCIAVLIFTVILLRFGIGRFLVDIVPPVPFFDSTPADIIVPISFFLTTLALYYLYFKRKISKIKLVRLSLILVVFSAIISIAVIQILYPSRASFSYSLRVWIYILSLFLTGALVQILGFYVFRRRDKLLSRQSK